MIASFKTDDSIRTALASSDLIIDALLGTGLTSEVAGRYRAAIDLMNESGRPIVAVDIPSGIHADSGTPLGAAVHASLTVTFGLPKLAYIKGGNRSCRKDPPRRYRHSGCLCRCSRERYRSAHRRDGATDPAWRRLSAHKGTFGHVGIIAGSAGKTGAAALAAHAALRMGAGLVTVATPGSVNDVLEAKLLEVMTFPLPETTARTLARSGLDRILAFIRERTAVAIGPGLSTHPETAELVRSLLKHLDRPSSSMRTRSMPSPAVPHS